jgi:hypothetical protein
LSFLLGVSGPGKSEKAISIDGAERMKAVIGEYGVLGVPRAEEVGRFGVEVAA